MKMRPAAVTMGPPRLGVPVLPKMYWEDGMMSSIVPNGTYHDRCPSCMSIACSLPDGGELHGNPSGDVITSRVTANGVPRCGEISLSGDVIRAASKSFAGMSVTRCITLEVLT